MPEVELVAAVAMPDESLGERLCLYVIPRDGQEISLEQIRGHLQGVGIAAFKLPERLELVGTVPMTKVGKIDKRALRDDVATRVTTGS